MHRVSRRTFLDLAAVGALSAASCMPEPSGKGGSAGSGGSGDAGGDGGAGSGNGGGGQGGAGTGGSGGSGPAAGKFPVGIAGYEDPALRAASVRAAIELAGGVPWL